MEKGRVKSILFVCILLIKPPAIALSTKDATTDWSGAFDLIGVELSVKLAPGENMMQLARRYGLGQQEVLWANPGLKRWDDSSDMEIMLPVRHILPTAPRKGLVVNLPEFRLFHYESRPYRASVGKPVPGSSSYQAASSQLVITSYPVSIGRLNWQTPLGTMSIVQKITNPEWTPTESLRREAKIKGQELPLVMLAGPLNPLGQHALRLSRSRYLIHGTNKSNGIGMRVSHGCLRLYPDHIKVLHDAVSEGLEVNIVNQPIKVGVEGPSILLEVHPTLQEFYQTDLELEQEAEALIGKRIGTQTFSLDRELLAVTIAEKQGLPIVVGSVDL